MNQANNGKVLGELESDVMQIVWQQKGPISVREVTEILQKKRKIAYTTVMTIMGRLNDKSVLKRKTDGKAYFYQAAYSKDKFLTRMSKQIIKNFVSSFGEAAIASFVQEIDKIPVDKKRKLLKLLKEANAK